MTKGYIYKLWSLEGDDIYIGSTSVGLSQRLGKHKNNFKNKNFYITSYILFEKYQNVKIEMLEIVEYTDKAELHAKEGEWIRNLKCVNKQVAGRTTQQYSADYKKKNKEIINKKRCEYYEQNKEIENEKHKEWCKTIITCECGIETQKGNLSRHKKSKQHEIKINDISKTNVPPKAS